MPYRSTNNPLPLIPSVPVLNGNLVTFPSWPRSTIKLTLSVNLAIRYKDVKPANTLFKTICNAYKKNTRARLRTAAPNLKSVKLTPADQQICDWLLRGLDDSWKTIRDHLVYSPNKVSLDDAIGALEAHKVSTTASLNHSASDPNKTKAKANLVQTRAGAVTAVPLGSYGSNEDNDDDDSFDDEIDVVWG
ncbi:hypothetical protein PGT21_027730 [Puccinia graminis f. sp. tritici]|uniref:Uncharacterized protein n=1 Tax=Puccinia graminis f. sp. tritici TaxID=56615 RepID=A0A5B0P5J0_PUCGR|nr:hypothetical protein PGT21_027730 [Puccinia graminis f. sp. tritici]